MRIQHNIMAMNAYRNYTNNISAMKKNLEKLSSGYKINRAGDDAAGLAISEKMRAQITGLKTAQKNAKDGISLVQTAEGALTEVHDMLNRMVELATQSANGTYDNTTDRYQLQKEMDQLNSEINRIADSANFNGIKLLDGSMDADGRVANTTTVFSGEKVSNNVLGTVDANKFGGANAKAGNLVLRGVGSADDGTVNGADDKSDNSVRYHTEATAGGKTFFAIELDAINFKADAGKSVSDMVFGLDSSTAPKSASGSPKNNCLFLTKDASADIKDDMLKYSVTSQNGTITGEDVAAAIQQVIDENGGKVYIEPSAGGERIEYTVTRDGTKLNFEMTNDGYNAAVKAYTAAEDAAEGSTLGKTDDAAKKTYFQGNYNFNLAYQAKPDDDTLEQDFYNYLGGELGNCSSCDITEGGPAADTIYAQAVIRFNEWTGTAAGADKSSAKVSDIIKDGAGLRFGDEYYVFAKSDAVYNRDYAENVHVVDIRDLEHLNKDDLLKTDGTEDAAYAELRIALDRLSVAAKDNEMFDVQVNKTGDCLVLNERSTYTGSANLTKKNFGLENQITSFDSAASTTTVTKEAGKALTLQIGDTAEAFNQLKVNIGDIHASSLGLDKISIADQESAAAAVDVIKAAINKVSDIRGTLGATQNRLDHTINNLSVMQENIQDAESTIRDVDVAEEMMAYTKNNILIQSAQAMLAQANQVPQGVLQLLQ